MNIKLIVDFDDLKYKTKVQMDALINLTVLTIVPFFQTDCSSHTNTQCLLPGPQNHRDGRGLCRSPRPTPPLKQAPYSRGVGYK